MPSTQRESNPQLLEFCSAGVSNVVQSLPLALDIHANLQRLGPDDLRPLGFVLQEGVDFFDRPVEGDHLEAVVVHVQDDVLKGLKSFRVNTHAR